MGVLASAHLRPSLHPAGEMLLCPVLAEGAKLPGPSRDPAAHLFMPWAVRGCPGKASLHPNKSALGPERVEVGAL